ncbi:hypothetical protein [Anaeromicropila populeti]|uniref:Lipoprotein n=1 Tax=Anaeromicropila populeti TaxID=37658 RepID=A0A1I6KRQ8_9FIRM|nr:hypothetical protein [Anaeromicropila populeti]SFR93600.1 hypothetical protein SAMN05661086_02597 [Anaeromicropila populeti]
MKRIVKIITVIGVGIVLLSACNYINKKNSKFPSDFYMGIILTTEQKQSSFLYFYDSELKLAGTKKIPYGNVGSTFIRPESRNQYLYVNAAGLMGEKNLGLSLEINLESGKTNQYNHKLVGPSDCAESDDYIFVCNNLNKVSHIVRCTKGTKEIKEFKKEVSCINTILCYENQLIAFAQNYGTSVNSYIYLLDYELNLLKTIDITSLGIGTYNTCIENDRLYFNIISDVSDNPNHCIGVLSLADYSLSRLEIPEKDSFDIQVYDGKLYSSGFSKNNNGSITLYDFDSNQYKTYQFDHPVNCFYINQGCLFIVENSKIYEYQIEEDGFTKIKEQDVPSPDGEECFYFISGAFFK